MGSRDRDTGAKTASDVDNVYREFVVMKEEKVFGEESAYTFNHEALSIEKIIQLLEDYGFITTVYEGFEGM